MKQLIKDFPFPSSFLKRDYILVDNILLPPSKPDSVKVTDKPDSVKVTDNPHSVKVTFNLLSLRDYKLKDGKNEMTDIFSHGQKKIFTKEKNYVILKSTCQEGVNTKEAGLKECCSIQDKFPRIINKKKRQLKILKLEKKIIIRRIAEHNKTELLKLMKEYKSLTKMTAKIRLQGTLNEQIEVFNLIFNEFKLWYHKNKVKPPIVGDKFLQLWGGNKTEFIKHTDKLYKDDLLKVIVDREYKSYRECLRVILQSFRFEKKWPFSSAYELYKKLKKEGTIKSK